MPTEPEQETLDELETSETPEVHLFDVNLIEGIRTKTVKLLANENEANNLKGSNRWFEYKFSEAVFVTEIEVSSEKYTIYDDFEFRWDYPIGDKSFFGKVRNDEGEFRITINRFMSGFAFRPPAKLFVSPTVTRVDITGLTENEFSDFAEHLSDLEAYRDELFRVSEERITEVDEREAELSGFEVDKEDLQSSITDLSAEVSALETTISELETKRDEISERTRTLKSSESDLTSRIETIEDSIDEKKNEQQSLNANIATMRSKLQKYKSDINSFTSNFSGYNEAAGRSATRYLSIALIPITIIGAVTIALFYNAADLTYVFERSDKVDVTSIVLTRMPYVLLASAIITACYKIAKIFISEVINISRRRQDLIQVSIIAKDVTDTCATGLELSDEIKFEKEAKLKMSLLRDHLKGLISRSYEYPAEQDKPDYETETEEADDTDEDDE